MKCGKNEPIFDQNSHAKSTCSNQLFTYKVNLGLVAVRQHVSMKYGTDRNGGTECQVCVPGFNLKWIKSGTERRYF